MFFFSVQVCLNPWTVLRQPDLQRYLFSGGKGMFLCIWVKKMCLWTLPYALGYIHNFSPFLTFDHGTPRHNSEKNSNTKNRHHVERCTLAAVALCSLRCQCSNQFTR